jgi:hypothetical protein
MDCCHVFIALQYFLAFVLTVQALSTRDSLAKLLYDRIFDFIVSTINKVKKFDSLFFFFFWLFTLQKGRVREINFQVKDFIIIVNTFERTKCLLYFQALNTPASTSMAICVLDIYGFEIFDNNGFEQVRPPLFYRRKK